DREPLLAMARRLPDPRLAPRGPPRAPLRGAGSRRGRRRRAALPARAAPHPAAGRRPLAALRAHGRAPRGEPDRALLPPDERQAGPSRPARAPLRAPATLQGDRREVPGQRLCTAPPGAREDAGPCAHARVRARADRRALRDLRLDPRAGLSGGARPPPPHHRPRDADPPTPAGLRAAELGDHGRAPPRDRARRAGRGAGEGPGGARGGGRGVRHDRGDPLGRGALAPRGRGGDGPPLLFGGHRVTGPRIFPTLPDRGDNARILLVLTVDTEEEGRWQGTYPRDGNRVTNIAWLRRLEPLLSEFGIKPTFLVDYSGAAH